MDRTRGHALTHAATLLAVGLAVWAIVGSWGRLTHTADEPVHLSGGLEWCGPGTHRLKPENPPVAQLAAGLGPFLEGRRLPPSGAPFRRGVEVLYSGGDYVRTLSRARAGALPFFLLTAAVVWLWARRWGGDRAAFLATASFCALPPVLGHSALASTDVPFLGVFLAATYAFVRWVEAPSLPRALLFGGALGLSVATKFSALFFVPPALVAVVALRLLLPGGAARLPAALRPGRVADAALALVAAFFVVWAAYRFDVGRLGDLPGAPRLVERCFPDGSAARGPADWALGATWPAREALLGLLSLYEHVQLGHSAYLFGRVSEQGFWYFYPVALAVKTPLAFVALALAGTAVLLRRGAERSWSTLAPAGIAAAVLAVAMPSTINIGVRHVLPVYPLLAVSAGLGLERLLRRTSGRARLLAAAGVGLLLVLLVQHVPRAHPNHLAWFNGLAGDEPGRVLLDSDLDWGQDVLQLAELFEGRDVELLHVALFGSARLCEHGLPPLRWLPPGEPVGGWIAISEMYFRDHWRLTYDDACVRDSPRAWPEAGGYAWLAEHEPVARAGRSIRVYHLPEPGR